MRWHSYQPLVLDARRKRDGSTGILSASRTDSSRGEPVGPAGFQPAEYLSDAPLRSGNARLWLLARFFPKQLNRSGKRL